MSPEDGASSRTPTALGRAASTPGPLGPRLARQAAASLGHGAAGAEGSRGEREALRGPPGRARVVGHVAGGAPARPSPGRGSGGLKLGPPPPPGGNSPSLRVGASVYNYCPPPRQQRRPGVRGCGGGGGEAETLLPPPPPPPQSRRGGGEEAET